MGIGSGGANRKSIDQLKKDGTYRKDRHGDRLDNHVLAGVPICPEGLTSDQQSLWDHVTTDMPAGVLYRLDSSALHELVDSYGLLRSATEKLKDNPTDTRARLAYQTFHSAFLKWADRFGLSPAARSKLHTPNAQSGGDDPFESLLQRMTEATEPQGTS